MERPSLHLYFGRLGPAFNVGLPVPLSSLKRESPVKKVRYDSPCLCVCVALFALVPNAGPGGGPSPQSIDEPPAPAPARPSPRPGLALQPRPWTSRPVQALPERGDPRSEGPLGCHPRGGRSGRGWGGWGWGKYLLQMRPRAPSQPRPRCRATSASRGAARQTASTERLPLLWEPARRGAGQRPKRPWRGGRGFPTASFPGGGPPVRLHFGPP